jgi:hypothetical protein
MTVVEWLTALGLPQNTITVVSTFAVMDAQRDASPIIVVALDGEGSRLSFRSAQVACRAPRPPLLPVDERGATAIHSGGRQSSTD